MRNINEYRVIPPTPHEQLRDLGATVEDLRVDPLLHGKRTTYALSISSVLIAIEQAHTAGALTNDHSAVTMLNSIFEELDHIRQLPKKDIKYSNDWITAKAFTLAIVDKLPHFLDVMILVGEDSAVKDVLLYSFKYDSLFMRYRQVAEYRANAFTGEDLADRKAQASEHVQHMQRIGIEGIVDVPSPRPIVDVDTPAFAA